VKKKWLKSIWAESFILPIPRRNECDNITIFETEWEKERRVFVCTRWQPNLNKPTLDISNLFSSWNHGRPVRGRHSTCRIPACDYETSSQAAATHDLSTAPAGSIAQQLPVWAVWLSAAVSKNGHQREHSNAFRFFFVCLFVSQRFWRQLNKTRNVFPSLLIFIWLDIYGPSAPAAAHDQDNVKLRIDRNFF